jgi:hypothetical protein
MTFDSPQTIQRVKIYWAWNFYQSSWMCSRQFSLEYWDDAGGSFQPAATVDNGARDSITTTDFAPVTTTRLRYWQPPGMGPNGYTSILWLSELEAYGTAPPGTPSSGVDVQAANLNDLHLSEHDGIRGSMIPSDYFLNQSYPNPFNSVTRIDYGLPERSHVDLEIFDVTGRRISILVNGYQEAGYHSLTWDSGSEPSGIYFYRLKAGEYAQSKKMTVVK